MTHDLARLIERNLHARSATTLRPRRQSRFEPAAIDAIPSESGGESTRTGDLQNRSHAAAAGRDADSQGEPPRKDPSMSESPLAPTARSVAFRDATQEVDARRASTTGRGVVAAAVTASSTPLHGSNPAAERPSRTMPAVKRAMALTPARQPSSFQDARDERSSSQPPVIEVTIGRVEVRAIMPAAAASAQPPRSSRPSRIPLEEYLRERPRSRR